MWHTLNWWKENKSRENSVEEMLTAPNLRDLFLFELEYDRKGVSLFTKAIGKPTVLYYRNLQIDTDMFQFEPLILKEIELYDYYTVQRSITLRTSQLNFAFRLVWITRPIPSITIRSTPLEIRASAKDLVIRLRYTKVPIILVAIVRNEVTISEWTKTMN